MKLMIIVGSVRENRVGGVVAEWYTNIARSNDGFEDVELIDLLEQNLPLTMEPQSPGAEKNYIHDYTKAWSKKVDSADAYVLIMPEYNHAFSAPIKNALDHVFVEWAHKPVAMVAYGSVGGTRSIESILPVLKALSLAVVNSDVRLNTALGEIKDKKVNNERAEKAAYTQLDKLAVYAKALQDVRAKLG